MCWCSTPSLRPPRAQPTKLPLRRLLSPPPTMSDPDTTDKNWAPPTPQSTFIPLQGPSPPPLVGFEPLPPPLSTVPRVLPSPAHWDRREPPRGLAGLLNADAAEPSKRATPSSVTLDDNEFRLAPLRGYFPDKTSRGVRESDQVRAFLRPRRRVRSARSTDRLTPRSAANRTTLARPATKTSSSRSFHSLRSLE